MELIGDIKNYDWGKLGSASLVAELASLNDSRFIVNENTPYSELWMGDHVSGPSKVKGTGKELGKCKKESLPFLFKVLSIRKALSIQVHPNKVEAQKLHKTRPDIYKDPNHKPELAIALTPFLALCGFRPYNEIYKFCQELPPLLSLLGGEDVVKGLQSGREEELKKCYKLLMTSSDQDTAAAIESISKNHDNILKSHNLHDVFYKVNRDFPNDVGLLSLFFLNLLRLEPGQAIFLRANEIHAYLSGDCVECMACSDNVIRAGLTPKYKDVDQLISCLIYEGEPANSKIFKPHSLNEYVQIFAPPVEDFSVVQMKLPIAVQTYHLHLQKCDAILLVIQGTRKLSLDSCQEISVKRGSIVFIPAEKASDLHFIFDTPHTNEEDFIAYVATKSNFTILK